MTAKVKFLFDTDFGLGDNPRPDSVPESEHHAAVQEAEARGYRQGVATGRAEAMAETERQLATAMATAARAFETLARGLTGIEGRLEAEAVEVAVAVADKLATTLMEREPLAEVSALASECFRHLVAAPHVVVRVNDALFEEARARLTQIAEGCGFSGRLVVLAESEMALGDCRIEWADGGATRDRAAIAAAIAEAVEQYLTVRREGGPGNEVRSRPS